MHMAIDQTGYYRVIFGIDHSGIVGDRGGLKTLYGCDSVFVDVDADCVLGRAAGSIDQFPSLNDYHRINL
jgi:hypothetical protein